MKQAWELVEPSIFACTNFVDVLIERCRLSRDRKAMTFLVDGERIGPSITFGEWDHQARIIGATLQQLKCQGRPCLMLYPFEGLDFVLAYFGVLYAGAIAVPTFPPDPARLKRTLARFVAIVNDAKAPCILTTEWVYGMLKPYFSLFKDVSRLHWVLTDKLDPSIADKWVHPHVGADTVAFLQYTSGSTGQPKGVMVTHGNLLENEKMICTAYQHSAHRLVLCWLPLYHDMGLIGNVLQPVWAGSYTFLMAPTAFLKKPYRWLKAVSDLRISGTGGPNFGYDLAIRKTKPEQRRLLDLSCLEICYCGSEPIHPSVVNRFFQTFAECGLSRNCFVPCYGLAEATLLVTSHIFGRAPRILTLESDSLEKNEADVLFYPTTESKGSVKFLMTAGVPWGREAVYIVDPVTLTRVPDCAVGEIWVYGPHVAQGYWGRAEVTQQTFRAYTADTKEGPFMRTGDLGFFQDGELYITGRLKDLIIVAGRNIYPQDIEYAAEHAHTAMKQGCSAAFPLEGEACDSIGYIAEIALAQPTPEQSQEIISAIVDTVAKENEIKLDGVYLIRERTIYKTTSGKIQRRDCKRAYMKMKLGEVVEDSPLDILAEWHDGQPLASIASAASRSPAMPKPVAVAAAPPPPSTPARLGAAGIPATPPPPASPPPPSPGPGFTMSPPASSPPPNEKEREIRQFLIRLIAEKIGQPESAVGVEENFTSFGVDSKDALSMVGELEELLHQKLPDSLLFEQPTIAQLSRFLAGGEEASQRLALSTCAAQVPVDGQCPPVASAEPMAIIGMACRFPGANDARAFWQLLASGGDAIRRVPACRWDADAFYDPVPATPGRVNTVMGGFLADDLYDQWDYRFFGTSKAEAARVDPQQRHLLEVAVEALEDAGVAEETYRGSPTGVFVGISCSDYATMSASPAFVFQSDAYAGTGAALSIAANRISYTFDLHGPSMSVDTACSSSLVSVDAACESIRRGQCSMALAGGVNMIFSPVVHINLAQAGFLSPDGHCKTFDNEANGYVRSEGCGMVVLKALSQAQRDGDRIYACVRATGVNQDGRTNGLTAPNIHAQEALIRDVCRRAQVDPASVQYVEAHGTGTKLGDPIEARALSAALRLDPASALASAPGAALLPIAPPPAPLLLGAAKSCIGHSESAAGVAGLIKLALSLWHRQLTPVVHYQKPNSAINLDALHLRIVDRLMPWPEQNQPVGLRLGGVSSFGFGGTNAHILLQEAPSQPAEAASSLLTDASAPAAAAAAAQTKPRMVPFSARNRKALEKLVADYRALVAAHMAPLPDAAAAGPAFSLKELSHYCLTRRTVSYPERCVFVAPSKEMLLAEMDAFLAQGPAATAPKGGALFSGTPPKNPGSGLIFVFTGQGTHWARMGAMLARKDGPFAQTLQKISALAQPLAGFSIVDEIAREGPESRLGETAVGQPCLFALQAALVAHLAAWNLVPDAVVGHSLGEITAAYVAGALSLEDAVTLVVHRGRCMQKASQAVRGGRMLAAEMTLAAGEAVLAALPAELASEVAIASHNSPTSIVFSGMAPAVEAVAARLEAAGTWHREMRVESAFHTKFMQAAADELRGLVAHVHGAPTSSACALISAATGDAIKGEELTPEYWGRQILSRVNFGAAIQSLIKAGFQAFIEVGPHPALSQYIPKCAEECFRDAKGPAPTLTIVPTLVREQNDNLSLLATVAQLHMRGLLPQTLASVVRVFKRAPGLTAGLNFLLDNAPHYPWQHERVWLEGLSTRLLEEAASQGAARRPAETDLFYETAWLKQALPPAPVEAEGAARPAGAFVCFVPAEHDTLQHALVRHLSTVAEHVLCIVPGPLFSPIAPDLYSAAPTPDDFAAVLAEATKQGPLLGVFFGWGSECAPLVGAPEPNALAQNPATVLHTLVQTISAKQPTLVPLAVMTVGTQQPRADGPAPAAETLHHAPLWGMAGVVGVEFPTVPVVAIDMSVAGVRERVECDMLGLEVAGLLRPAVSPLLEDQIALRGADRFVLRLQRAVRASLGAAEMRAAQEAAHALPDKSPLALGAPEPGDCYVITGGLGGFALNWARMLYLSGARHLVLMDIRPYDAAHPIPALEELRKLDGLRVDTAVSDLSSASAIQAQLDAVAPDLHVRGIYHTAGLLDRKLILKGSPEAVERVLRPKVAGSWALHEFAARHPVRHFVLWSSFGCLVPSEGESSYAAANAFLDALARHRAAAGLPVLSVNWGVLGGAGLVKQQSAEMLRLMEEAGLGQTPVTSACVVLAALLARDAAHAVAQTAVFRLDWARWMGFHEALARRARFAMVYSKGAARREGPAAAAHAAAAEEPADHRPSVTQEALMQWLLGTVAEHLNVEASAIDPDSELSKYGLDSMAVVSISNAMSSYLGQPVSPTVLYSYPTVRLLVEHFAPAKSAAAAPAVPRPVAAARADEPIAIVGMACRYPGGVTTPQQFWDTLVAGRDCVGEVPAERYAMDLFYDRNPKAAGKSYSKCMGHLKDLALFDPSFWGMTPLEAERMDPQHRLVLECAWEALEDAGIPAPALAQTDTGVYVGISYCDYSLLQAGVPELMNCYTSTGSALCMAANRLSYLLDLRGPSVAVDSACSSSLSALHLACTAMRAGECGVTIVSGVNTVLTPTGAIGLSRTGALSPEGRCKSFDNAANGFVRSEGCGVIVLKPLSHALRDGDLVHGLIRATMLNQDGKSQGLTAPNGLAQQALLRTVYEHAGVSPLQVSYVETHGTGTDLGDPIEVDALCEVLLKQRRDGHPLVLGALKSVIGHTESAAGVAGVIKCTLVLQHRQVPPNLHLTAPNERIPWAQYPTLAAPTKLVDLPVHPDLPLPVGGVSSFGFGGTNGHIVLQAAPAPAPATAPAPAAPFLFLPLSARSEPSLRQLAARYRDWIAASSATLAPADLLHSAALRRAHHAVRVGVVAPDLGVLGQALDRIARGVPVAPAKRDKKSTEPLMQGVAGQLDTRPAKVAFVYTGQGAQWMGMGRDLLDREPVFRDVMQRCDALIREYTPADAPSWSLLEELANTDPARSHLEETAYLQPATFAVEVAVTALLASWGVFPQVVVGHSIGELAAAHVSGALSLEDAMRIVVARSLAMQKARGGKMLVAGLTLARAEELLQALTLGGALGPDAATVAVHNNPESVVFSGTAEAIDALAARFAKDDVFHRALAVTCAFHSPAMAPAADALVAALRARPVTLHPTSRCTMVSTVTGRPIAGEELTAEYWGNQVRSRVNFAGAVENLLGDGAAAGEKRIRSKYVFVEVGPHPHLKPHVEKIAGREAAVASTLLQELPAYYGLYLGLATLYARGVAPKWSALPGFQGRFVRLPLYPWNYGRYWLPEEMGHAFHADGQARRKGLPATAAAAPAAAQQALDLSSLPLLQAGKAVDHPLLGRRLDMSGNVTAFTQHVRMEFPAHRYIYDHYVIGAVLVPGVTYVEMGLGLSATIKGPGPHTLTNIEFDKPQFLGTVDERLYQISVTPAPTTAGALVGRVEIHSIAPADALRQHKEMLEGAPAAATPAAAASAAAGGDSASQAAHGWTHHARMNVHFNRDQWFALPPSGDAPVWDRPVDLDAIRARCPQILTGNDYYDEVYERGLQLRERFRGLTRLWISDHECLGRIDLPAQNDPAPFQIHPTMLDSSLQAAGVPLVYSRTLSDQRGIFLPVGIERMLFYRRPPTRTVYTHVRMLQASRQSLLVNLTIIGEDAIPVAEITNFRLRYVDDSRNVEEDIYNQGWVEQPLKEPLRLPAAPSPAAPTVAVVFAGPAAAPRLRSLVAPLCAQGMRVVLVGLGDAYAQRAAVPVLEACAPLPAELAAHFTVRIHEQADYVELQKCLGAEPYRCQALVHAAGLFTGFVDLFAADAAARDEEALAQCRNEGCLVLLGLVKATQELPTPPHLFIVTAGVQPVAPRVGAPTVAHQPAHSALWGMGGTVQTECPQLHCTLFDLSVVGAGAKAVSLADLPAAAPLVAAEVENMAAIMLAHLAPAAAAARPDVADLTHEETLTLAEGAVFVSRMSRVEVPMVPTRSVRVRAGGEAMPWKMAIGVAGNLSTLRPVATLAPVPAPGPREVVVQVHAAGINFRDVLKALGLYPAEFDETLALGAECSGVVLRCGSEVTHVRPGDRVVAISPTCFASHVVAKAAYVCPVPAKLSMVQAAGILGPFLTAHYAMITVGRLRKGERVLIHAATGGVGLAALQIARRVGAIPLVTAGSPAKRDMLAAAPYSVPREHIFDSRSLGFLEGVLAVTKRRGVDMVLNSLAGELLEQGFALLAPRGRFVEIGKRDIYENSRVGLRPLAHNCSFHAIALDNLFDENEDEAAEMLREVMGIFGAPAEERPYESIPVRAYPVAQAEEAFRFMSHGKHTGKLVLTMMPESESDPLPEIEVRLPAPRILDEEAFGSGGTAVVTGGTGGLGMVLVQELIRRGATRFALLGIFDEAEVREKFPDTARNLDGMRHTGAKISVIKVDVSDRAALAGVLAQIRGEAPIVGVFHLAGLTDDELMSKLDRPRFERVVAPKIQGTWNLHVLTLPDRATLRYFVMYSSVAALLGSPGQANYSSGNAFLNGMARARTMAGLPVTCVNWGPLGKVGMMSHKPKLQEQMEQQGVFTISPKQLLWGLRLIMARDEIAAQDADPARARIAITSAMLHVDWPRYLRINTTAGQSRRFAAVGGGGGGALSASAQALRAAVAEAPSQAARVALLVAALRKLIAAVTGLAPTEEAIPDDKPLNELGLDSMVAVELRARMEQELGATIPIVVIIQGASVLGVAAKVLAQIAPDAAASKDGAAGQGAGAEARTAATLQVLYTPPKGEASARPPISFVPMAGGSAAGYSALAQRIGAALKCPVWAFEDPALFNAGPIAFFQTMPEMAAAYTKDLVARQPAGPYIIAGHSVGAFVAFEMARQLRAQGRVVSHVLLLDPPSPDLGERIALSADGELVQNPQWDHATFAAHHGFRLVGAMMLTYRALHSSAQKPVDEATCVRLHAALAASGTDKGEETPETWRLFYEALHEAGVANPASDTAKAVLRRAVEVVTHEIALFHSFDAFDAPAPAGEAAAAGPPAVFFYQPSGNAEFVHKMLHLPSSVALWRALLPKGGLAPAMEIVPSTGDHWSCLAGDVDDLARAFVASLSR